MQLTTAEIVHMAGLPAPAARAYAHECRMWPAERERHLYITGRTAEAAILDELADIEENGTEREQELRAERDELQKDIDRMEGEARDSETAVENAEERVLTLTSQLENAQDEIKALQSEIREKCLDLL